jgi:hypothetical protein
MHTVSDCLSFSRILYNQAMQADSNNLCFLGIAMWKKGLAGALEMGFGNRCAHFGQQQKITLIYFSFMECNVCLFSINFQKY